jgi:hypothetical protein
MCSRNRGQHEQPEQEDFEKDVGCHKYGDGPYPPVTDDESIRRVTADTVSLYPQM